MRKIWVLGSGSSIMAYRDKLRLLKNKTTLAFSSSFDFCHSKLGFYPTYWTWVDPQSAIEGLKHLISTNKAVPTTILLLSPAVDKSYEEMKKHFGSTSADFKAYKKLLVQVVDKGICKIERLSVATLKHINQNPKLHKEFQGKVLDGADAKLRFSCGKIVIGMNGFPGPLSKVEKQYVKDMNGLENKLTMAVLPICHHLKASQVNIIGFDGKGGRWNQPKNNRGLHHSLPTYSYLNKWNEWVKYTNMSLCSVASEGHTVINKYVKYIPINDELE